MPSAVSSQTNGINRIRSCLLPSSASSPSNPKFIAFLTAGFPTPDLFPSMLLALQQGGADLIEVGVPFSDPIAEGPTIQASTQVALDHGINSLELCLDLVNKARDIGLVVPVVFMGYANIFLNKFDSQDLIIEFMQQCRKVGICGFIIVDLPPEESNIFRSWCKAFGLSFIPLIAPTTVWGRIEEMVRYADSFVYCVSVTGVTGARAQVDARLPEFIDRVKSHTPKDVDSIAVAIGFGISSKSQFEQVGSLCNAVVIGSAIIKIAEKADPKQLEDWCKDVCAKSSEEIQQALAVATEVNSRYNEWASSPDSLQAALAAVAHLGNSIASEIIPKKNDDSSDSTVDSTHTKVNMSRFGQFGGRYAPETLTQALDELEILYRKVQKDPSFWEEFKSYYRYMGRPSQLHVADRLTEFAGGAKIWLKREDLNHTGAHKINNAIGQALLAKRLGKKRMIAETGAGQHGVATATVCAKLGLDLTVYMGAEDCARQELNVFRMRLLGAKVIPVQSGSKTLKDAINEAMRDWVTNIETTHYLIGSAIGPYPFPEIVRDFQSVIGQETREYFLEEVGCLPDAVVACVGGGSNAIGMFYPFVKDESVRLVGVEAAGDGIDSNCHSATLTAGRPGVLHGTRTYLLQDKLGQVSATHSISAGLDYPGVGPEHAYLKDIGRAEYVAVNDRECLRGLMLLTRLEGIIPALETSHAVYHIVELAKSLGKDKNVVLCVSGRGDKDVYSLQKRLPEFGLDPTNYEL